MQKPATILLMGLLFFSGCSPDEIRVIKNDFKVHTYYVVPSDMAYSDAHASRVAKAIIEIQRWYQAATGGITFEILDEKNIIEVYFADNPASYYENDWWNLLLNEMRDKGEPIESPGTLAMLWIEGITKVAPNATALGGFKCNGDCGAALLPMQTILSPVWPPLDMGITFHELGHALGLNHPVEESDLPLPAEQEPLLYSVMCQTNLRKGTSSNEHAFLTFEKQKLFKNPFLKKGVNLQRNFIKTNIINYPVTGVTPDPQITYEMKDSGSLKLSAPIDHALLYYWYFSDGSISNEPNPEHVFKTGGSKIVSLMVTDINFMTTWRGEIIQLP